VGVLGAIHSVQLPIVPGLAVGTMELAGNEPFCREIL
jgi:hypothetical protein